MATELKQCSPCKATLASEFQDKTYGTKMRVFNQMKDPTRYRCTVCVAEKSNKQFQEEGEVLQVSILGEHPRLLIW